MPTRLPRPWSRVALAAGLLPILVAVVALAALPPPEAQPAAAQGPLWIVREALLGEGEGNLREGEPWVGTVPVKRLPLRQVAATLTWTDDAPATAPDEFTLELVPPAGLLAGPAAEGRGGRLEITVPVYALPPQGAPELGVGGWKVRVYLRDAGDGATLGVLPGASDGGNPFRLEVAAQVWEARAPDAAG